ILLTLAGLFSRQGEGLVFFWRSSMTKSASLIRFVLVVALVLGSIQAGKAAIDSVQASVVQHQTALAQAAK
ncbi:hypothetical protein ACPD1I_003711, partial [Vibrio cholerae]